MSTKLEDCGTYWLVSTVSGIGGRRKIGRGATRVPKGDPQLLRAEMVRQAEAARLEFGVQTQSAEPVV